MKRPTLLTIALAGALFTLLLQVAPVPVVAGPNAWSGSDFAYYFAALEAYWRGVVSTPYSHEALRAMMQWRWEVDTQIVMPIAYSPGMIWILKPFDWISERIEPALVWNFLAWALLSFVLLRGRYWQPRPLCLGIILLLVSPLSFQGLALAQSTHLGVALFLILMNRADSRIVLLGQVLALFLLSLKPTYFLLGVVLTLIIHNRRTVIYACGLAAAGHGAALAVLPAGAALDWWRNISFHSTGTDTRFLTPGITRAFANTLTLRALLSSVLDPVFAWKISRPIFILCAAGWGFLALYAARTRTLWSVEQRAFAQAIVLGSFLFVPTYLGRYEELLLIPFFVACARAKAEVTTLEVLGTLLVLVPAFQAPFDTPLLIVFKLAGIAILLWNSTAILQRNGGAANPSTL